jgi:hypothetical protein
MNTTKTTKLYTPSTIPVPSVSPWLAPAKLYQDLILKPEFAARRYKFPPKPTWFRIVPARSGSDRDWMLGVHALQYSRGCHAHSKTIVQGGRSVFDVAYAWLKQNRPNDLFSKQNKDGFRLLTDPSYLCWILVEEEGKIVARLLLAKGYDGSRGGAPGLGHQIWQLSEEVDENGDLLGNPADPVIGAQICVEKRQTPESRYPSYTLRMGRVPAPIDEMLAKMDPEEMAALCPLEQVVYLPGEEQEWILLENVIDADTIGKIRNSVG